MSDWTLTYGGQEKTLADWGLGTDLRLQRVNQGVDILTVSKAGAAMDEAPTFAYGQPVVVRRDRVSVGGGVFSAGSIYFQGKAINPQRVGRADAESVQYAFANAWWDLERLVFCQTWKAYSGNPAAPGPVDAYSSDLLLGTKVDGTRQTNGQQIVEVLDWAIARGVSLLKGTIDAAAQIPSYYVRDMTCAEVITQMARWTLDIAWFDYTTTPPTLHMRSAANLTAASVAVADKLISEIALQPRYDLQLPAVWIRYKAINTVNGTSWVEFSDDKYPIGSTGLELGASVHTVELAGMSATTVETDLVVAPILALSGTESLRIAWWQSKLAWLRNSTIKANSIHVTVASVEDAAGNPVVLGALTNELISGQIADWMDKSAARVTLKALLTYDRYQEDGQVIKTHAMVEVPVSAAITATDATTGHYNTISSYTQGEAAPVGLAQAIYDARSTLQYDGSIDLVDTEIPAGVGMGTKLTVTGTALTLAGLVVQGTVEEPHWGRIRLQVGPPSNLGVADLVELLRVNRYRLIYNAASARTTGQAAGTTTVGLGTNTPADDTTTDTTPAKLHAVSLYEGAGGTTKVVALDAENHQVHVVKRAANNDIIPAAGEILLKLSDAAGKKLYIQEMPICIGGVTKHIMTLCSDAY